MIKNFDELSIDQIAWSDRSFRTTFRRCPELLLTSVREVGILNPLVVTEVPGADRFRIVCGWLRFEAARTTERNSVPCHIYRKFPDKIMLLCCLFDNLGHRQMNAVEQALTLTKLREFYSQEEAISSFLPLLGYRPSAENWERLIAFSDMPEAWQWSIAEGELNEQAAVFLRKLPGADGSRVYELFRQFRLSASLQREIAEMFYEIWERDDTTPGDIISAEKWEVPQAEGQPETRDISELQAEIASALEDNSFASERGVNVVEPGARPQIREGRKAPVLHAQYDSPDRKNRTPASIAEEIRSTLRRRRFPHLKRMEEAYAEKVKDLKLPPQSRLIPVPYFESSAQKLEIRFNSGGELKQVLERLLDNEERGAFDRIFSALRSP
jgi:hypothetical protein